MLLLAMYLLFLPPLFSSVDPETAADAAVINYVTDDPSLSEQPGKPPPLITRYRLLFSILLALE